MRSLRDRAKSHSRPIPEDKPAVTRAAFASLFLLTRPENAQRNRQRHLAPRLSSRGRPAVDSPQPALHSGRKDLFAHDMPTARQNADHL